MIKKIIFDIDNTLITWEDEKNWNKVYYELTKKFKINNEQFKKIQYILNNYDLYDDKFNKEKMQEIINNNLKKQYNVEFLNTILSVFEICVPEKENKELKQVLKYLSEKYQLVVLTNWFKDEQEKRLVKYGIRKYFLEIYGPENFKMKPNKESYIVAAGKNNLKECIMIGDSLEKDVKGAINSGMRAIWYNPNYIKEMESYDDYEIITDMKQLEKIL